MFLENNQKSDSTHSKSITQIIGYQSIILPPVLVKKDNRKNFDQHRWMDKLQNQNNIEMQNLYAQEQQDPRLKQHRTSSLYSLQSQPQTQSQSTLAIKVKTDKKPSPQRPNQYNKWFIPPEKRFIDLQSETQDYIQEQYIQEQYRKKYQQYYNVIRQSKHLTQFIRDFQKQHKRNPTFIHQF